jgi:hypothetical protein
MIRTVRVSAARNESTTARVKIRLATVLFTGFKMARYLKPDALGKKPDALGTAAKLVQNTAAPRPFK